MTIKKVLVASLAWGLLVTGCSESDQKSSSVTPSFKVESLTESAWLFESLPENTVAYTRIPNPWSGFSAKEDSFKYALGNKEHVKAVKQIQQSLQNNIVAKLPDQAKPLVELYFEHTTGPVEIAFVNQKGGQPVVYAATRLDYQDSSEFNSNLEAVVEGMPNANLMPKEEAQGIISMGRGMAIYYDYDASSQKFTLISGMGASVTSLENAAELIKPNKQHEMLKLENTIDASHQGLFAWISPKNAMPLMQMGMSPNELKNLQELGVDQANGLALGYGVSGGKTRLKLLLDMPDVGMRQFLPIVENNIDVNAVGEPNWAATLSIPTVEQSKRIANHLIEADLLEIDSWQEINQQTKQELGTDLETLIGTLGPEAVVFSDDIGTFLAARYNEKSLTKALVRAQEEMALEYRTYDKEGLEIHHLKMGFVGDAFDAGYGKSGKPELAAEVMKNYRENYFWMIEDGYVVFANVPQLLLERSKRKDRKDIGEWLEKTQGENHTPSLLSFTASVDDLSRSSYHYYLEALIMLGDLSGAKIDILSLPTADQLGFSEKGAIGVSLSSGKEYVGLEFTFENGATDLMVGAGSATAVAMVGILAAVAIPAYQDYVTRSEMTSGNYVAESVKLQVAQALISGAKVEDIDSGNHGIKQPAEYANSVVEKIVVKDGVITVFFSNAKLGPSPQTIVYVPVFDGKKISYWDCRGGTVAEKYRPAMCK